MHEVAKVGWNNEVVKRQTREQFVSDHPHIAEQAGAKWDEVHAGDEKAKPEKSEKGK